MMSNIFVYQKTVNSALDFRSIRRGDDDKGGLGEETKFRNAVADPGGTADDEYCLAVECCHSLLADHEVEKLHFHGEEVVPSI